jgi:RecA/RadA recombinase
MAKKRSALLEHLTQDKKLAGSIIMGGDEFWETPRVSTGIPPLDAILSGGFGLGRTAEIYGNYSSGKTYVLLKLLATCQASGGTAVLIDTEGAFDAPFFLSLGGDPAKLITPRCDTVEDVFETITSITKYAKKNLTDLNDPVSRIVIGWDGIAATPTKHLMTTGMEKRDMSMSIIMSQGTKYITSEVKDTGVCVVATNQIREKINSMDSSLHTPGGKSWPFHASQRLELRFDGGSATSQIMGVTYDGTKWVEKKEAVGRWLRCFVEKNKLGRALRRCALPFYFALGERHPIYDRALSIGVDLDEAIFDYLVNYCELPSTDGEHPYGGPPAILSHSAGYFQIHPNLGLESKKFRQKDWPEILAANPSLMDLLKD